MQSDDDIRDKSFRILDATVSPLEVSPGTPRRRWSSAARERIVLEAMAPGANVSAVARAYGLKPQQLFGWRRRAMAEAGMTATGDRDRKPSQPRSVLQSEPIPFVELSMETGGRATKASHRAARAIEDEGVFHTSRVAAARFHPSLWSVRLGSLGEQMRHEQVDIGVDIIARKAGEALPEPCGPR